MLTVLWLVCDEQRSTAMHQGSVSGERSHLPVLPSCSCLCNQPLNLQRLTLARVA
jgi:hypothetical protein